MPWPLENGIPVLLLEGALKSTAILSLALVVSSLLRKHSASLRHFILSFSLISLILIPVFLSVSAGWETPLLPSWLDGRPLTQNRPQALPLPNQVPPAPKSRQASVLPDKAAPPLSGKGWPVRDNILSGLKTSPLLAYSALAVWCAGLFFLLLRMGFGLWRASRLTEQGEDLDDSAWRALLGRFLSLITLKRKIVLKSHHCVAFPLTWGWRRPVILMPDEARAWTEPRRSSALLHELSHVKRADFLVMMFVRLSLAFFWFNPLTWLVLGKMKKEQEKACDEGVIRAGIKPSAYAFHLLSFQKQRGSAAGPTLALLGLLDKSLLNDRLLAILRQKLTFKEVTMKTKMMLSLAVVAAVILVGTARPSSPPMEAEGAAHQLEEALPEPGPVQAAAVQEKQEGKEGEKTGQKPFRTIVVKTKGEKEGTVEVTLTEGEKVNKMILDTPVTIKQTDAPERTLVILSKDKEVLTVKGGGVRLEIDALSAKLEGKTIVLEKGKPFYVVSGKEPEGLKSGVHIIAEPGIKIIKKARAAHDYEIVVSGTKGKAKHITLGKAIKLEPGIMLEAKGNQLQKLLEQIQESLKAVEEKSINIREVLEKHRAGLTAAKEAELKKTLEEVFERLESDMDSRLDVQQEALRKLEEELKELSVELQKKKTGPHTFTIVPRRGLKESETVITADKGVRVVTITTTAAKGDKETLAIAVKAKLKKADRITCDQAVEKMKSELPEGFSLDYEFDEDSGTAVFKIKAPASEEQKAQDLLKKLLGILEE